MVVTHYSLVRTAEVFEYFCAIYFLQFDTCTTVSLYEKSSYNRHNWSGWLISS